MVTVWAGPSNKPSQVAATRQSGTSGKYVWLIAIPAATLAAFLPATANGFVNWDDPYALTDNTQLGAPGILAWAFSTRLMGHFQPLAWLTWSAVSSLAGKTPAAFHTISLIGHLLNATLVYLVSRRLAVKGSLGPSTASVAGAGTALLFAVHPLRVEPVAWASAFPYIQALTWLLLGTLAYLHFADAPGRSGLWLGISVSCYVMSLLSRVAAPGYPVVLLILDVFPLRRLGPAGTNDRDQARVTWTVALAEKLPYVIAASVFAFLEAGSRETAPLTEIDIGTRLTMAARAPIIYLSRMLVPVPRSPIDPLPIAPAFEPGVLALALFVVVALTGAAWLARRRWPADAAGWFIYLVLLAPVIGLMPSGQTETADRYMYLPGVALSMIVGVAVAQIRPHSGERRISLAMVAGLTLPLGVLTWHETRWWHDSATLWTRALQFDERNDIATYNLAVALQADGRSDQAIARYEQTLALIPDHEPARRALVDLRANRGFAFAKQRQFAAAASDLRFALDAKPDDLTLAEVLSFSLAQTRREPEAVVVLKEAIARHPDNDELAHNLARLLATSADRTVRNGALALRLALAVRDRTGARDPRVLDTLAAAYAATGQLEAARRTASEAQVLARQLGDDLLATEIAAHPWSVPTRTTDAKR